MVSTTHSFTLNGITSSNISVECDTANGLPSMTIVGIPASAADGIKERVRSAILNSGLDFPRKRITINLAPAGAALGGPMYDLPIALAILLRSGQIEANRLIKLYSVGELGLAGDLRPVRGILGMAQLARDKNCLFILPAGNQNQADLVRGCQVLACSSLKDVFNNLTSDNNTDLITVTSGSASKHDTTNYIDIADVIGQATAKRAIEIVAAGNHNLLMTGPPGTGKTMLAKTLCGVLPSASDDELITISQIHSLGTRHFQKVVINRPFRSPHHSISHTALVGGGPLARPGEISLAHGGILLLDEAPEFSKQALESLRQPMEEGFIRIDRANQSAEYPANFILAATMNPCPCGYYGDPERECSCTMTEVLNYQKKLSGPILDRIDIHIPVERLDANLIEARKSTAESSATVRKRVTAARLRQAKRFGSDQTNADMTSIFIRKHLEISTTARSLLSNAVERLQLSPRAYFRVLKVARTIADLAAEKIINDSHVAEALQYRLAGQFQTVTSLTPGT